MIKYSSIFLVFIVTYNLAIAQWNIIQRQSDAERRFKVGEYYYSEHMLSAQTQPMFSSRQIPPFTIFSVTGHVKLEDSRNFRPGTYPKVKIMTRDGTFNEYLLTSSEEIRTDIPAAVLDQKMLVLSRDGNEGIQLNRNKMEVLRDAFVWNPQDTKSHLLCWLEEGAGGTVQRPWAIPGLRGVAVNKLVAIGTDSEIGRKITAIEQDKKLLSSVQWNQFERQWPISVMKYVRLQAEAEIVPYPPSGTKLFKDFEIGDSFSSVLEKVKRDSSVNIIHGVGENSFPVNGRDKNLGVFSTVSGEPVVLTFEINDNSGLYGMTIKGINAEMVDSLKQIYSHVNKSELEVALDDVTMTPAEKVEEAMGLLNDLAKASAQTQALREQFYSWSSIIKNRYPNDHANPNAGVVTAYSEDQSIFAIVAQRQGTNSIILLADRERHEQNKRRAQAELNELLDSNLQRISLSKTATQDF